MSDDDVTPTLGVDIRHPIEGWHFNRAPEASVFWSWYETIKSWGTDHAYEMAAEGALLGRHELTENERTYLHRWIASIEWNGDIRYGQGIDRETQALSVSYDMLQRGEWTRPRAARFAENLLGRPIQSDTWRKRLDKWIKEKGKPPLHLPRSKRT